MLPRACRVATLSVFVCLCFAPPAAAQNGEPPDRLQERLRLAGEVEHRLHEQLSGVDLTLQLLERRELELAAQPPMLPTPIPWDMKPWEQLRAELDVLEIRLQRAQRRQTLRAELRSLHESLQRDLALLLETEQALGRVLEELAAILATLPPQTLLPQALQDRPVELRQAEWRARQGRWAKLGDGLPARRAGMEEQEGAGGQALTILKAEIATTQLRLQVALEPKTLTEQLAGQETEALNSLFRARLAELSRASAALIQREQAQEMLNASVQELNDKLVAVQAPAVEQPTPDDRGERLRQARRDVLLAEGRLRYHRQRVQLLEQLADALAAQARMAEDTEQALRAYQDELLEVDVVVHLLTQRAAQGDGQPPLLPVGLEEPARRQLMEGLPGRRQQLLSRADELETQALRMQQARTTDLELVQQLERELPRLNDVLRREEELDRYGQGLRELTAPDLLQELSRSEAALQQAAQDVRRARDLAAASEVEVQEQWLRLNRLIDPLVRQTQARREDLRREITEKLEVGAPIGPPESWVATVGEAIPPSAGPVRFDPPIWVAQGEQDRNSLTGQVTYLDERLRLTEQLRQGLSNQRARLQTVAEALDHQLDVQKRHLNVGREILVRVGRGELQPGDVPPAGTEAARLEAVLTLEGELRQAEKDVLPAIARYERLTQTLQQERELRQLLHRRVNLQDRGLEILRRLIELEAERRQPLNALSELERTQRDQEVADRLEADNRWYEALLNLFSTEDTRELEKLLLGYYEQLLAVEGRSENLDRQLALVERLKRLVLEERDLYQAQMPLVENRLASLREEELVTRYRIRARYAPSDAEWEAIAAEGRLRLQELRQNGTLEVPPRLTDKEQRARELVVETDRLFDRRAGVLAFKEWLDHIRRALGRLGLDQAVGALDEQATTLRILQAEEQGARLTLLGRSQSDLEAMDEEDRPTTEVGRSRFLQGEIGWTRSRRVVEAGWAAARFCLFLLLIPAIALGLIRLANRAGQQLIDRVRQDVDPNVALNLDEQQALKERQHRTRTLFNVFKTAWKIGVVVLAIIYLLKALGVDATPLLASAGIFGLAVAFGAQSLVKDFFAGFFILMENQYKLGDWVNIDGCMGQVEAITLRLTILRDREGSLHFIPNGSVGHVTNRTKDWGQVVLDIGVAYKEHPDKVIGVLNEVCANLKADPVHGPKVLEYNVPGVEAFGDSSISFRVVIKVRPGEQWKLAREARRRIKLAFDEAGVEIPFPQRVVYHHYPRGEAPPPGESAVID